jgi:hypothetical protein
MGDPDGRIHQYHQVLGRRRGGGFASRSLPPKRARRRALSRSINAFRASRIRLDFSFRPVKAWALATSSSSRATVVRINMIPFQARGIASYDAASDARQGARVHRQQSPHNRGNQCSIRLSRSYQWMPMSWKPYSTWPAGAGLRWWPSCSAASQPLPAPR